MKPYKFFLTAALITGISTIVFFGCQKDSTKSPIVSHSTASYALGGSQSGNTYSPVTLSSTSSTLQSIDITVTAGTTGAPAGFSIQWMPKATFDALNGVWPSDSTSFCSASFSGKAFLSNYNLAAGGSVTVRIGDLLLDNGASTNCGADLTCGTTYVFRAFAHGDKAKNKSGWSSLTASTLACPTTECVHAGFGYWKEIQGGITAWPGYVDGTSSLTIGGVSYTYQECMDILNKSDNANGLVILAHQLIAAMLNQLSGAQNYDLTAAQAYFAANTSASNKIPPVGSATTTSNSARTLVSTINAGDHSCN